jgi:hypothetical protein
MNDLKVKEALLLGSEKRSIQEDMITSLIHSKIASCKNEEERFLDLVTYNYFYNNNSLHFRKYEETSPRVLINETKEVIPEVYNEVLRTIFLQDEMVKDFYLKRWIFKVGQQNKICHPKYILEVINSGSYYNEGLRKEVYEIIGEKGKYMLTQFHNDRYKFDVKHNVWEEGVLEERKKYFQEIRLAEPSKAIELLDQSWQGLNIKEKIAFTKILAENIEIGDLTYINNWYKEYDMIKVDKHTTKELKKLFQSIRYSLDQNLLDQLEVSLRPYIVKSEADFFKKFFQGSSNMVINLPSNQDDFWNGENMNRLFGFDEKNMDIAIYDMDSAYWLSCLIELLPFKFWSKLLGGDGSYLIEYFLDYETFIAEVSTEKISILRLALIQNLKNKNDKVLLKLLFSHLPFHSLESHCHLLTRDEFEAAIIENNFFAKTDLYHKWHEHNRVKWSSSFTKKVMEHSLGLAKTNTMSSLKEIGIAMALYIDESCNNELEKMDEGFRNKSWYPSFREKILLPVQMGTYINNTLNQL